jgi:hypothetical protein
MKEMLGRVGNVCYWVGLAAAGLFLLKAIEIVCLYLFFYSHIYTLDEIVRACVRMPAYAFLSWLAGRSGKYILAGT